MRMNNMKDKCIHMLECGYIHQDRVCYVSNKCKDYEADIFTKELKMGDVVKCRCDENEPFNWVERIFIKYAENNGIITVKNSDEQYYKIGMSFNTVFWSEGFWRIDGLSCGIKGE